MDEKTKKALENLQKAINGGEFEEYFKKEKIIIDYLDSKIKRLMDGVTITPELEKRFLDWFKKYKDEHKNNPNIWDSFLNLVIEEGERGSAWDNQKEGLYLVATITWKEYTFVQFWPEEGKLLENGSLFIIYKDKEEILRM